MDENWATMWEAVSDAVPDRPALIDDTRTRTYAELDDEAARVAGGLAGLGLGPGDPVAFLSRNSAEFLVTLYALFKLRAIPLNLNLGFRDRPRGGPRIPGRAGHRGRRDGGHSAAHHVGGSVRPRNRAVFHHAALAVRGGRGANGGAAFSPALKQELIDRTGASVLDQVGASEGGPLTVQVVPPGGRVAGHPFVLGPHATLIRDDHTEIPAGSTEIGRFALSGALPEGYHRDPAATAQLFATVGGTRRVVTGDYGYVDPRAGAVFLGRGRTVVNTGGEKVYPAEVEDVLLRHPDVVDAVVVGVPDSRWGQAVAAVVQCAPGRAPDIGGLRAHVRAALADYKTPRRIVVVDRVRRTEAGKVRYDWARAVAERAASEAGRPAPKIDTTVPNSARVWNYWLGGKDNYAVDRKAGDRFREIYPEIAHTARTVRYFLARVVRYLAGEAGIRQFLDIGAGLPAVDNTHEVAQRVAPECKIVYVDNDPLVLAYARALLVSSAEGSCGYIDADVREPGAIVDAAAATLDFTQPVAVMLLGILGHVSGYDEARSIVRALIDAVPSGSYLALCDAANTSRAWIQAHRRYAGTGAVPYYVRSPEQIAGFFDGLDLLEPGVVPVPQWRPDLTPFGPPRHVDTYGGVACKTR